MTIAGVALKTSLLIAMAGLLAIGLRRQSAAFKHLLWTSALTLCVLMPVAVLLLPSLTVVTLQSIPASLAPSLSSPASGGGSGWGSVFGIWLFGFCCILLRELLATLGLARWRRHAQPVSSTRWTESLETLGVRDLRVVESHRIASPCTWGVLRPILLLPSAGDAWPESARRSALLHELAHVRRLDALSTLIARLACALHWYNPLVWFAAQRVRNLQERACDDAVLRAGAMPSEYAQFLLDVAAHMSGMSRPTSLVIGMAHSSLRSRIVAILDPKATRAQPQRVRVIASCASLFAFTILLATASVAVEPPPPPEKPERPKLPGIPQLPEIARIPELPEPAEPPRTPTLPKPPVPPIPAVDPTQ